MPNTTPLPVGWEVPEIFHHRLGDGPGRQRVMQADGHLLLILHVPPRHGEKLRGGRYLWRNPEGVWQSNDLGSGNTVLARHLEQFAKAFDRLQRMEDEAANSDEYFQVISELAPLLRASRNLHSTLQQAREQTGNDRIIINARDKAYEIERSADLLYNEAKNELDYLIAYRVEQQAVSSHRMSITAHRLNILAAFFFPIVTLATVFSTQLKTGLEEQPGPVPFFAMLAVGLILGIGLNFFVNVPIEPRKRKRLGVDEKVKRGD